MKAPALTPAEARVVAAMVEKHRTLPDSYPLSANAILGAANQKTARYPVMALTEGEVLRALTALEGHGFVRRADEGSRVAKWREHFAHALLLDAPPAALLAALVLRGPQTAAEARSHAEPLGGPRDAATAQALLSELAARADPLAVELPRAPGQAATRWAHTLCGAPDPTGGAAPGPAASSGPSAPPADDPRLARLEARVAALEAALAALAARLESPPAGG